ncbi:unnamed protein product [Pleuronectes platessa]|uniref:Uncharacterized protein n=1 Tax=Pleuronectes platessa TaxID=8262 RepID=A0A9N7VVR0_PLEPL|nr:unnamed protein product [Pleuronectes platessa]
MELVNPPRKGKPGPSPGARPGSGAHLVEWPERTTWSHHHVDPLLMWKGIWEQCFRSQDSQHDSPSSLLGQNSGTDYKNTVTQ